MMNPGQKLAIIALTCLLSISAHANFLLGVTQSRSSAGTSSGSSNQPNIGMNLYYPQYWSGMAVYADVAKQISANTASPWPWAQMPCCAGTPAALDSTGAPTVAAYTFFTQTYPTATMTLTWTGAGSISSNCSDGAITGGPTFSRTVTCTQVNSGHNSYADIGQYQLIATPPVTNIHLQLLAGLSTGIFNSDFISKTASFSTFRPMQTTNSAPDQPALPQTTNWSDRTWPNESSWAKPQGMPYEDMIALANQTNKNIWLNISVLATDDYVCRLARLLHYGEPGDKLNAACNPAAAGSGSVTPINTTSLIYVEFGNEIWNDGVYQTGPEIWCWVNGAAEPGHSCTTSTGISNSPSALARTEVVKAFWNSLSGWDKVFAYQALMSKRHHDIFQQVFGANFNQVQIVYGIQANNSARYATPLNFMVTNYGALNTYLNAIADAPYVVPSNTATVAGIIADLNSQVTGGAGSPMGLEMAADLSFAQSYSLGLVAYEAGQSTFGNTTVECAAQWDPGMYTFYTNYYNLWKSIVGQTALIANYVFTSVCGASGNTFGTLNMQSDNCSQKWRALMNLTGGADCTP